MATSVRKIIEENEEAILASWEAQARQSLAGQHLTRPQLVGRMHSFLGSLLQPGESAGDGEGASQGWLVDLHVEDRFRQGYELPEIIAEFEILGRCIEAAWLSLRAEQPSPAEIEEMHDQLRRAATVAGALFEQNLVQAQQSEERFLRRLQRVADFPGDGTTLPRPQLHEMLAVVSDALNADMAGLYLFEPKQQLLQLAASIGDVTSFDTASLAARLAAGVETLCVTDVQSGSCAVLGIPLLARGELFGAIYAGVRDGRRFEPREVGLFEVLSERLGAILHTAYTRSVLRANNEQLRIERELREQFVAVLAHDLLGRLATVKSETQFLQLHPEHLTEKREIAERITRELDLTDRMIRDLLDAQRIRAGHRLALRIESTDLAAVARDVARELASMHGERFRVRADDPLWGFWSGRELRRAIWNLASNAIKYGDPVAPVEIKVAAEADQIEIAVHNQGPVIPAGERAKLFDPFWAASDAEKGQRGWGLGLTLVKGCAEAHGGSIEIESKPEEGTTFILRLPPDARPFQEQANGAA